MTKPFDSQLEIQQFQYFFVVFCKLKFVFIHNHIVINLVTSWCGAAHKIYAYMCLYRRESLFCKIFAVCTFCKDIFFLEIGYIRVIWAEDFIFHTFNAFF